MEPAQVAELAAMIKRDYSAAALDPGVSEPTVVEAADGSRALVLPRDQQPEPLRSLRLVDAAAVGATLVLTFTWADGTDGDTVYLMPLDARDLDLDLDDPTVVTRFLLRHPPARRNEDQLGRRQPFVPHHSPTATAVPSSRAARAWRGSTERPTINCRRAGPRCAGGAGGRSRPGRLPGAGLGWTARHRRSRSWQTIDPARSTPASRVPDCSAGGTADE